MAEERRLIAAGNWKMNGTYSFATELAKGVAAFADEFKNIDIVIAPVATLLRSVHNVIEGHHVGLAAQNVHYAPKGAYTGELSLEMIKECSCDWVILGHSERRQYFGETDEDINRKTIAALKSNVNPIVCVGESLADRKSDWTSHKVALQVRAALSGLSSDEAQRVVIAYEPLWAIGTGETASPEQAQEVHGQIRKLLSELYCEKTAQAIRILYGGSVKPGNIEELIAKRDIDGALVGGASLKADDFKAIAKAISESAS